MTRQESFKKRIRARMALTGEKYGAARRVLIEQADRRRGARAWVAEPEVGDEALEAATGRRWNDWCDIVDAWPGHAEGHTAVAEYLRGEHGLDGWWSQQVTGGWERITGRRLPGQMPDGTFTANKSRTMALDATTVRELLLDDEARADLFNGAPTTLRSRPESKAVRLGMVDGVAQFGIDERDDGQVRIAIQHHGLESPAAVEAWKLHWSAWLDDLDAAARAAG